MLERWIIIHVSGAAFGPVLYSVFVAIIYRPNMTIQLRTNIYNNNYAYMLLPFATIILAYVVANGRSIIIWIFFSYSKLLN